MSIASQPLPGVAAVEEHNDVDHSSVSLAVSMRPIRPCGYHWFAASASLIRASGRYPVAPSSRLSPWRRRLALP